MVLIFIRNGRGCLQSRKGFSHLNHIADAYRAMDERRAFKSLVRVGAP